MAAHDEVSTTRLMEGVLLTEPDHALGPAV